MIGRSIRTSSVWAAVLVLANYLLFYSFQVPLLTEWIAEWIMAHTPNDWSVAILSSLGEWAKPFAATGGLAAIGFVLFIVHLLWTWWRTRPARILPSPQRREFVRAMPLLMSSATVAVAVESYARNRAYAARAVEPVDLFPFRMPEERETFAPGLVRRAVTSTEEFYAMSKNAVDPVLDPRQWRLQITLDGKPLKVYSYTELLALPRTQRYTTMRCVSNTLKSNLMGTAEWSGLFLRQLISPQSLPSNVAEVAFLGADGHDDSIPVAYAFSGELLLSLGMNGKTLNRTHGFPVRLLAPKYYGFKSVKWLSEIRFVSAPYFGTWPKMGYTREPVVHTVSYFDRVVRSGDRVRVGGVSFAGVRGIARVQLRAGGGEWQEAQRESPLSPFTWTRWKGDLLVAGAEVVEARALDGEGRWQENVERPIFPDGVAGPTLRKLS